MSKGFLYIWKVVLKLKEDRKNKENQEKKTSIFFCLRTFTWRDEISLIKVAYLMLNFLNLKSFLRHLFFWVASCLSMVCRGPESDCFYYLQVKKPDLQAKTFDKIIKTKILLGKIRANLIYIPLQPDTKTFTWFEHPWLYCLLLKGFWTLIGMS